MTALRRSYQSGNVLFLALIATSLVGTLAYQVHLHALSYKAVVEHFTTGIRTHADVLRQLRRPSSTLRVCELQIASAHSFGTQQWFVCALPQPPLNASLSYPLPPGRIDYESLLHTPSPCPGDVRNGQVPRATSPRAAKDCLVPTTLPAGLATLDNLVIQDLNIERQPHDESITLATPGSITSTGVLSLPSPTLIVAGGDLSIATITTSSAEPITVTIVSAHGDVRVQNISANISALALGRGFLLLPATTTAEAFILPPFIPPGIVGIRPRT